MDSKEFVDTFMPFRKRLCKTAYCILKNAQTAEDFVQETLYKAFIHKDQYTPQTKPYSWLRTIMTNTIYTFFSSSRLRAHCDLPLFDYTEEIISSDNSYDDYGANLLGAETNYVKLESLLKHYLSDEVVAALAEVPDIYKEPLLLQIFVGLKPEDIADQMNTSNVTVRTRMHRGKIVMKRLLTKQKNKFKLGSVV